MFYQTACFQRRCFIFTFKLPHEHSNFAFIFDGILKRYSQLHFIICLQISANFDMYFIYAFV